MNKQWIAAVDRRASGLNVMLWGLLLATVPYLIALVIEAAVPSIQLPGGLGSFPYTLFFTLIPLSVTYALLKHGRSVTRPA